MKRYAAGIGSLLGIILTSVALAWTPLPVDDDHLVRMPGTQPGQVSLEAASRCMNCHSGDDTGTFVSVGRRWQGSMMGQAARDPLFYSCLVVALQDSIWALGNPNAGDLCMRCHFPKGWLEDRSDPVNASLMLGADFDGIHCDFCHSLYDPFFEASYSGEREGGDWSGYWDEATPAVSTAATAARDADLAASELVTFFNGLDFFDPATNRPQAAGYTENGSGQFFVSVPKNRDKRAPFADNTARHNTLYSRYHRSRDMCSVCHDVSNPVLQNMQADPANPLPTETESAFSYFHVERTFSEFKSSGYGQQGGMAGTGPYAPDLFKTSRPGNLIANCQDCHFADTVGRACTQSDGLVRPTNSADHPLSGQPAHDMMGGNAWIPYLLASTVIGSPNYSETNAALLKQGPAALTLDFSQGESLHDGGLLDAAERAQESLERAAGITDVSYNPVTGECEFRVINHTGHKLISGFPEGRRMFVNIRAFVGGALVFEVNPYDADAGTLKGLDPAHSPGSPPLAAHEVRLDELVYEVNPKSDLTGESKTFHFVLATGRFKDNRIPPRGFRVDEAIVRQDEPVWQGLSDPSYFTAAEYAGGYDEVGLRLPRGAERIEFQLYYQTTSREYVEFLRDQINGTATTLSSPTPSGEPQAYIVQTDPFFSRLKAWGTTMWELWWNNRHVPGAAPIPMADMDLQLDVSDDDGDGIPAFWEILHFSGPTNAVADIDSDGDGWTNREEYIAMTDPLDPTSSLRIQSIEVRDVQGDDLVTLSFTSSMARIYGLQTTDDLVGGGTWLDAVAARPGVDGNDRFDHTNPALSRLSGLYRLTVRLP